MKKEGRGMIFYNVTVLPSHRRHLACKHMGVFDGIKKGEVFNHVFSVSCLYFGSC